MCIAFREPERRIKRSVSFEPCRPRPAKEAPTGPGWLHAIKHDGFRIVAQKDGERIRLITRNGYDFTDRYGLIVEAIRGLPVKSCVIDGEAIVVDQEGLSVFDLLRYRQHDHAATLCAFDLIEIDGNDLRRHSIEDRKWQLGQLLRQRYHGIALNETYTGEGGIIYRHACALGCEGIVSKRLGSQYRMGRTDHWIKTKNPLSPAVKREREIDWSKR
jgi:bifunctional non-homologous end joining protein LigD